MIFVLKRRESRQKKVEETHHWSRIRTLDKLQTLNEKEDGLEGEFDISKEDVGPRYPVDTKRWPQEN